ncbi:hypothetical protein IMCC3317_33890 [Kordia antarctica]|uniref:Uncharacterized protein n=1 Tax=Kordia antarctica TaxID=1218801 RepID=A0A7L4ZP80_9FLAO|nr:hypothetical protein [Kordia antarctica]QHI38006.1 hypothetical protein IMCC3317_33890 [Kordia antarctica]
MKSLFAFFCIGLFFTVNLQGQTKNRRIKKVAVKDSIVLDSVSINPFQFKLTDKKNIPIDSTAYRIDFEKGILYLNLAKINTDSIRVSYTKYPEFLTKKYSGFNKNSIVQNPIDIDKIISLRSNKEVANTRLFDGLNTSGSISRGVTVGNNQNTVLNSELDLQISGKISETITLRASIQDANIPIQESGYSQRLDEFDQVFIELESKNWKIRAGDVNLENTETDFMRFQKKVQGVGVTATLPHENSKTTLFAAAALVRGRYTQSRFQGQEGNQGPYKLTGPNEELFILIVSGSETVFVNGLPVERGENNDYVIDYNAGEITFTSKYPITSEMRITIEYQFTDNNYTRFVTYGGAKYEHEKFKLAGHIYSENDSKNQPIQQNLSEEQVAILREAGDNQQLMSAPSAVEQEFSENRILYKKEIIDGMEVFVFSNNPDDTLFDVRFSLVGENQGNYMLSNTASNGRIYEYVSPISGILQGNYEPIIQLVSPTKTQVAVLNGSYTPSEKTDVQFEVGFSNNDENLFSSLDDDNNQGLAAKISVQQQLLDKKWKIKSFANFNYIDEKFQTIERLYSIEFNRDWNLDNIFNAGNQQFLATGLDFSNEKNGTARYSFEYLDFKNNATGNRHIISSNLKFGKLKVQSNGSYLTNETVTSTSDFLRLFARSTYSFTKSWIGAQLNLESNEQKEIATETFTPLSQRFKAYTGFVGVGDSLKIHAEIGFTYRVNDSLRTNNLERVNTSNTYFLKSKLVQNKSTQLSLFVNYRTLKQEDENISDEKSLNSRLVFQQRLFDKMITLNTVYETNSGTLPQQEFTYVQVDQGQGVYTWNDYNDNGIQELDEFELAQFPDEAIYVRVLLPNQIFIKTHQNKFSQVVTLNPTQWNAASGMKKFLSHFYNQASFLIDRKIRRENDNFNFNPFDDAEDANVLGLNQSLRNALFFNRGKQKYTTSYTYLNAKSKNLLSIGSQENINTSHQLQFTHKIGKFWLTDFISSSGKTESISENFLNKNFEINLFKVAPTLSYLFNRNSRFSVFYKFENKENSIGDMESLTQQKVGVSFAYSNQQKVALNGEFNYFKNDFSGNAFSPVGYQMLEGLQPGTNLTWNILIQKKLTKFLDLNLSYFGRKSKDSRTIHTGNVQLKAFF